MFTSVLRCYVATGLHVTADLLLSKRSRTSLSVCFRLLCDQGNKYESLTVAFGGMCASDEFTAYYHYHTFLFNDY